MPTFHGGLMHINTVSLLVVLAACTPGYEGKVRTADPSGGTSATTDTGEMTPTGSDTDSETGTDDSDTTTTDTIAVEMAEKCGMDIVPIKREEWGTSIRIQNSGVFDWGDAQDVALGIASGYSPPFAAFPNTDVYPSAYNDATDILNSVYGWGWCCDVLDWPAEYQTPSTFTVHYSADHISSGQTCQDRVVSHYNYHTFGEGHGWGDYGYNFGVCEDSSGLHMYEGRYPGTSDPARDPFRSVFVIAANVANHNTGNIGVVYVDDSSVAITTEGLAFYKAALFRAFWEGGLTDPGVIIGHQDWSDASTDCPGDELERALPEIRAHVQECLDYYGPKAVSPPMMFAPLSPLRSSREPFGD